ncbi:MAG: ribonuclease III [Acidimicrobiia bacterium]|nr:ribonuclease III [Acidimicrobiia bacterium]MBT8193926.1 ribonuclease III [Acidimicrobiia bacterium]NNF88349.1 ribonuclease III [Acidimicrobiia bacterium]NNL14509.1 ribonuclease III [Acidimicrobiia bacterium]NNL69513.1 ribonuclease III [Acidimicrobiia bacterium]
MTDRLEAALGHTFANRELLGAALTHRSYASEDPAAVDYERLEFLGDAVLQLAVTEHLYADYAEMPEGQMAKLRAAVVNEEVLAEVALRLDVGPYLRVGKGEEVTGGREKTSILSDVVEALLGAVYLDAGFDVAAEITLRHVAGEIDQRAHAPGGEDFKTRLQETLAKKGTKPDYRVSDEGPDHDKVFHAEVTVEGRLIGSGSGTSKKAAEQAAAEKALRTGT